MRRRRAEAPLAVPQPDAPPPPGREELYATQEFWNRRYECASDTFEWYFSFAALRELWDGLVKKNATVLDVGCGNSDWFVGGLVRNNRAMRQHADRRRPFRLRLFDMCAAGHTGRMIGIDNAPTAIAAAEQRASRLRPASSTPTFEVGDATAMRFAGSSLDVVLDKGTMDAMLSAGAARARPVLRAYCAEVGRVLAPPGVFVLVTHLGPHGSLDWLTSAVLPGLFSGAPLGARWRAEIHSVGDEGVSNTDDEDSERGGPPSAAGSAAPHVWVFRQLQPVRSRAGSEHAAAVRAALSSSSRLKELLSFIDLTLHTH